MAKVTWLTSGHGHRTIGSSSIKTLSFISRPYRTSCCLKSVAGLKSPGMEFFSEGSSSTSHDGINDYKPVVHLKK